MTEISNEINENDYDVTIAKNLINNQCLKSKDKICDKFLINNNNSITESVKLSSEDQSIELDSNGSSPIKHTDTIDCEKCDEPGALIVFPDHQSNCDKNIVKVEEPIRKQDAGIELPKPILSNGGTTSVANRLSNGKKSVSFDTNDDSVKKFTSGEIIVDKENPFKSLNAIRRAEFFSLPQPQKPIILPKEDFVTTEDVLKESKFVKTYVKNPDKYFEYDPSLRDKLRREEEKERADRTERTERAAAEAAEKSKTSSPKRSRISKLTHERLKELKNKYSPPPFYGQNKIKNGGLTNGAVKAGPANGLPNGTTKVTKKKIVDRSRYPDLSQIKVKVGTDLEGSFFNPKEVAINAKKFDARIRNTRFGSQDDLDEITDLTSGNELDVSDDLDEVDASIISRLERNKPLPVEPRVAPDDKSHSFTNTVNSKEFQEYLRDKGLSLLNDTTPVPNGSLDSKLHIIEPSDLYREMDSKKTKKPSVLQRLFPTGIFSSRRKTTPKENTPEPKSYTNSETRTPGVKRLVLERQSFHGVPSSSLPANSEFSRHTNYGHRGTESVASDDRSSSISSALTNAEIEEYRDVNEQTAAIAKPKPKPVERRQLYADMKSPWKMQNGGTDPRYSESDSPRSPNGKRYTDNGLSQRTVIGEENVNSGTAYQNKGKPLSKIRPPTGRSSVPVTSLSERLERARSSSSSVVPQSNKHRREPPVAFENKSPEVRDGIIKPRVQRAQIPISNLRPLPGRSSELQVHQANGPAKCTPPVQKRGVEKQSRKPIENGNAYGQVSRNAAAENKKRNPPKVPERTTTKSTSSLSLASSTAGQREGKSSNRNSIKTPSNLIEAQGPKSTSTPISECIQPQFNLASNNKFGGEYYYHEKAPDLSPITPGTPQLKNIDLDTYTWAKLRELKEKTDRQLYTQPRAVYTQQQAPPPNNVYGRSMDPRRHNIYERLPLEQVQVEVNAPMQAQPQLYAKVDKRNSGQQRNPPEPSKVQQRLESHFQPLTANGEIPNFVRNSPQRNTISGVFRTSDFGPASVDGQIHRNAMPNQQLVLQQQPPRSQSVLDDMVSGGRGSQIYGSANSVVLRKKACPMLTRQEILSQVSEFCRKSMNKTPTKFLQGSNERLSNQKDGMSKTSSEVSPISYASMDSKASASVGSTRSSAKVAPQVPQRIQSLPQGYAQAGQPVQSGAQRQMPIYEPIFKRGSIQSYGSDVFDSPAVSKRVSFTQDTPAPHQRTKTLSETDSASGRRGEQEHYQVPRSYLVMDSEKITPARVLKYQQQSMRNPAIRIPVATKQMSNAEPVYAIRQPTGQQQENYGQLYQYPNGQYGYVQLRNANTGASQIYYPSSTGSLRGSQQMLTAHRLHSDGRSTPLVLHAIPQQRVVPATIYDGRTAAGSIVVLENVEQMYRPIAVSNVKVRASVEPQTAPPNPTRQRGFVRSGKHIVPYECEGMSDAEEAQMYSRRPLGKFFFYHIYYLLY